jgi:hypothetical protein
MNHLVNVPAYLNHDLPDIWSRPCAMVRIIASHGAILIINIGTLVREWIAAENTPMMNCLRLSAPMGSTPIVLIHQSKCSIFTAEMRTQSNIRLLIIPPL